jgi:hypothetical protein
MEVLLTCCRPKKAEPADGVREVLTPGKAGALPDSDRVPTAGAIEALLEMVGLFPPKDSEPTVLINPVASNEDVPLMVAEPALGVNAPALFGAFPVSASVPDDGVTVIASVGTLPVSDRLPALVMTPVLSVTDWPVSFRPS